MVDPTDVTKYQRTDEELEEFLLFCVTVAGKTAKHIAIVLDRFLKRVKSPFAYIRKLAREGRLEEKLRECKTGNYKKLAHAFSELANSDLDLRTCTTEDLEEIKGIGPKTSRYFILHSRRNQQIACIDTHILRWLRDQGYDAPKATPTLKKYKELEQIFIKEAKKRRVSIAKLDLDIWNKYSTRSGKT